MADDRSPRMAPYGAWASPITAALVAGAVVTLSRARALPGGGTAWLEGLPNEGGRVALVRDDDGVRAELTPPDANVRTRVHEYGGGACAFAGDAVLYAHFPDQRLYRIDPGASARPITPEPAVPAGDRYADMVVTSDARTVICVRERHGAVGEPANELVVLSADGSGPPRTLVAGHDFFSTPRLSPDGRRIAWLSWDHPRMPWDGTELWVAPFDSGSGSVGERTRVAGGPAESVFQPAWSPEGELHFVSDRTGWWNLYAWRAGAAVPLAPMEAECGGPQWSLDAGSYDFLTDGQILCVVSSGGVDGLVRIDRATGTVTPIATPFTSIGPPSVEGTRAVFIAASPTEASAVVSLDVTSGATTVLRRSLEVDVDDGALSTPEPITFTTTGGATAHAIYYPPRNRDFVAPAGERPPLIVMSHGGPTAAANSGLSLRTQYWTSRGFAVVDVNYRGSTGYGRAYRDALQGAWGVVDVDDCVAAARFLADRGDIDGERMAIRGGSAGGYTTLAALAFRDAFAVGASYYGIGDLETLAKDTHKFESRYGDGLIGPYPEARAVYRERSPIHHVDQITCPVILFQGLEDRVVPPAQAEAMAASLRARAVPYAYMPFAGEQHGFRRADTTARAQAAELWFYGRVLGFTPAERIEPVEIVGDRA